LELEKFDVNLIAERRYQEIAVAFVESVQKAPGRPRFQRSSVGMFGVVLSLCSAFQHVPLNVLDSVPATEDHLVSE
jgi:hypothetical protein